MSMPKFKKYTTYNEVTNTFPYTIQSSGGGIICTPTDPPVDFPAITTEAGYNNIHL